jgi:hypothetical protein
MREQLPPFILAELFSNLLVDTGDKLEQIPGNANIQNTKKKYLGNYEKKIVVLVNDSNTIYLNDECLEFLTGILNACKLNLAHIALINLNNYPLNFQQLQIELQPAYLLSFGVKALQIELPFNMPDYQVQQYSSCTILTAPALTELNQQNPEAKTEKTKLWKSLKKMLEL